jgi:integrase
MNLPYVCRERLPSGGWRYRFQRGGRKITLRGDPGSPEMLDHYRSLMDGAPLPASNAVRGSVEWLVGLYLADLERSVAARLASPLTLKGHRHHLAKVVAEYGPKDANMPQSAVILLADKYRDKPGAARNLIKAVSALYRWAIPRGHVTGANPARDVPRPRTPTAAQGFTPWTEADFAAYLARHKPGSMARRALILAMTTTARRDDLRQLGRQHEFERDGRRWIGWVQSKAPSARVEMPKPAALAAEVAGHPQMTYLLTEYGRPFTHAGLGNAFRKWAVAAGAEGKSLHGVRKGVAGLLTAQGATTPEIDVLLGHEMGSGETRGYVRAAARKGLAEAVVDRLDAALQWG